MNNNDYDKDNDIIRNYRHNDIVIIIKITISLKSILIIDKWLTEYPLAKDISHLPFSFSPYLLDRIFLNTRESLIKKVINYYNNKSNENNNPSK